MPEDRHSGTPGGGNGSGADVKSGLATGILENSQRVIPFTTAFASVPHVVVSLDGNTGRDSLVYTLQVTATKFDIFVVKLTGGAAVTRDVHWIATDAGDP